jgi:hypothetical protein
MNMKVASLRAPKTYLGRIYDGALGKVPLVVNGHCACTGAMLTGDVVA